MHTTTTSPSATVETVLATFEKSGGVTLDTAQRLLAGEIIECLRLTGESTTPLEQTGYFIYGPPGRGKSWLMSQLFETAPFPAEAKRRVHFHDFFRELQQHLGHKTSTRQAIEATLENLLPGTQLFYFDELHVHDPGSAALLNNLLRAIAERGIPTLITSNYEPKGLLSDPMFHHVIEPSVTILRDHFKVQKLDGGTDYRSQRTAGMQGFAAGQWLVAEHDHDVNDILTAAGLTPPTPNEAVTVLEGHRALKASAVRGSETWFTFADLLGVPSITTDFLDLVEQFDTWVLTHVPRLSQTDPASRQRLVTLIDVLVDRDIPLTVCAEVSREALVDIADPPPDLFRARSRLQLLAPVTF
ncbi:MAG TPA: cell division protein ZapE [Enteractinococcus sp.]